MTEESDLTQMLKVLLEDRQRQNEEMMQERRRRDEESARRDEEVRRQMDLLKGLVEGVRLQGETAAARAPKDQDVKLTKLTDDDDIEAYLLVFERLMKAYELKKERWAFKLAPYLTVKVQQAYAALGADDAAEYEKVKVAILRRYDVNEETYRRRFRSTSKKQGETNRELVNRLDDLVNKWMQECKTIEEVKDEVIREQVVNSVPEDVRIWVKERKPKSGQEAAGLADDYAQARKEGLAIGPTGESKKWERGSPLQCSKCHRRGHLAEDCRSAIKPEEQERRNTEDAGRVGKLRVELKDVVCYNCQQKGHYSSKCPANAMLVVEQQADQRGNWDVRSQEVAQKLNVHTTAGVIEGVEVQDILLDTGCAKTIVREDYVPKEKYLEGEMVAIRCAHGDTDLYPLAQVGITIDGQALEVEVAVSQSLPMSMLLGTDVPELRGILDNKLGVCKDPEDSLVVDDDLVVLEAAQTKAQRERVYPTGQLSERELEECCDYHVSTNDMQEADTTLGEVPEVELCESAGGVGFFEKDGPLYRYWASGGHKTAVLKWLREVELTAAASTNADGLSRATVN